MEEKINIAEILKDKPQGTKLYADAFGELSIEDIYTEGKDELGITLSSKDGDELLFYNNGKYNIYGEPILVPSKSMHDWSKFAWKKGDVLVSEGRGKLHVIFEAFNDDTYTTFKGKHFLCNYDGNEDYNEEDYNDYNKEVNERTIEFKKDNDDGAQTYINTIEERLGGKLNRETLEVEKTQPKFKDGDIIKMTWGKYSAIVIFREYSNFGKGLDSHVFFNIKTKIIEYNIHGHTLQDTILRLATEEEKQQLFSALKKKGKAWDGGKKAIVDLKPKIEMKPFDKVLVRDSKSDNWRANLFGYIDKDEYYHCVYANWAYCIPYIGNESLLGTTKDVEG